MSEKKIYSVSEDVPGDTGADGIRRFFRDPDRLIFLVLLIIAAEWVGVFCQLGIYEPVDDAHGYIESGLWFARSGIISIYNRYPTAMIMPGMTVLIGALSSVFGSGAGLTVAVRVLFGAAMCLTALYMYKSAKLLMPKGYALLCACAFLGPHYAWIAHNILTETPYYLFSMINLYCMLRMGMTEERRYFVWFILSFLLALMFRANILTTLPFSAVYVVLCVKRGKVGGARLLRRGLIFLAALAAFVLPWTVRNYIHFNAFVPITYGGGNPLLQGTYQFGNPPEDWEIDADAVTDGIMLEKYADYYDADGNIKDPAHEQYLSLRRDSVKARYRIRQWLRRDPGDFFKAYLFSKERSLINWVWYDIKIFNMPYGVLHVARIVNTFLCFFAVVLAFVMKRCRFTVCFLLAEYGVNLVLLSTSLAIERYAEMFMPLRFLAGGIGLMLMADGIRAVIGKTRQKRG